MNQQCAAVPQGPLELVKVDKLDRMIDVNIKGRFMASPLRCPT
jgi:NADP-dependent 3-hydroxy acid dehydrogenase YdfG